MHNFSSTLLTSRYSRHPKVIVLQTYYWMNLPVSLIVLRLGFEPKTYCLEGSCSIQLSYRSKQDTQFDFTRSRVLSPQHLYLCIYNCIVHYNYKQSLYPEKESNPHHMIRSHVFYPLNYRGKSSSLA